ncbi:MAG TPA: hypothetical protein DCZ95_12895 [Verrucomicrobia bacterium]|nr:MAG: hypothetical protein A2X46_11765 [Lentisphaerae bacterium GWF2_57_35]HBA84985.1 hypothetical protein [Verrucomicrobiota bacterium]
MIASHIHDALSQVRRLQELILNKRQFMGYSGKARIASGVLALAGAGALSRGIVPATPEAHLIAWGIILAGAVVLNYSCLAYWFFFDDHVRRNPIMLKPALDAIPALAVGAALTVALVLARQFDLLFGVWMCLYGLAQAAYRQSLPGGIYLVGLCYILCGAAYLVFSGVSFLNPWPMGLMFFLGELAGGWTLIHQEYTQQQLLQKEQADHAE